MVEESNAYYGATNLDVQNVVFVHGSIDPWYAMGRLTDLNENSPAIIIPGSIVICVPTYCHFTQYTTYHYHNCAKCLYICKLLRSITLC